MYNILVNNLSIMAPRAGVYEYAFQTKDRNRQNTVQCTVKGSHTNEAVTRIIMKELREQQEKLDEIICLATETVRKKTVRLDTKDKNNAENVEKVQAHLGLSLEEIQKLTHFQLYEKCVEKMTFEEYGRESESAFQSIKPKDIEISDNSNFVDIYKAVTETAKRIIKVYEKHKGKCRLFLDYTGGDRTASTAIIALTKMLEERHIQVDHIYAVINFNPGKEIQTIQEKIEVNYIFDFISGLNEFTSYGRAEKLNEFIKKSRKIGTITISEQADNVLTAINSVADHIQLCRSATINDAIGRLVEAIENYQNTDTFQDPVFDYLIEDIKNNYIGIYNEKNRTIPNIIKWCLEKNLIQQAATFYAELLPKYLVDEKILFFSKREWDHVEEGIVNGKEYKIFQNDVQNYLYNGTNRRNNIRKGNKVDTSKRPYSYEYGFVNYYFRFELASIRHIDEKSEHVKYQKLINSIAGRYTPYAKIGRGVDKDRLADLLTNYFQFKKLVRNKLNHASKEDLDMEEIKSEMIWINQNTIFQKNGEEVQDVTVEILTKMIHDLLEQIQTIR